MCHLLLVMPFVSLVVFLFLPFEEALAVYLMILAVCAVLYWLIWKAIRRPVTTGVEGMIGGTCKVLENGSKRAKVFYKGEIWDAVSSDQLSVGDSVEIARLEKLTLVVRKAVKGQARGEGSTNCH